MIPFNVPTVTGRESKYINEVLINKKFSGDGHFSELCCSWFETKFQTNKTLLTTSCTHSLEMAAILIDIKEGDEVIMPSYTFVSTANAFVLRGAKIVFVDIRPDTMNINETLLEQAITKKTKAIVVVHYAGVACDMDKIMSVANQNNLTVIEDAAQGVMSYYKGRALGTIGHIGCYSFHETKNYQCGEGGLLLLNDKKYVERAEIIREKGTDRSKFFRGEIDKYSWVDIGSSYLMSELNAAFLFAQLENSIEIKNNRLSRWQKYYDGLEPLEQKGRITLPFIPKDAEHNGHIFYMKTKDLNERTQLIKFLKDNDIMSVFHYIPLHSTKTGGRFGEFIGEDIYTTLESQKLVRLPLYYNLKLCELEYIIELIFQFYHEIK